MPISIPAPPQTIPRGHPTRRPGLAVPQAVFRLSRVPSPGGHFRDWVGVAVAANLCNNLAKELQKQGQAEASLQAYAWKSYLLHGAVEAGLPELTFNARDGVLYWPTPLGQFSFHVGIIRRLDKNAPLMHRYSVPFAKLALLHSSNSAWHKELMQLKARELAREYDALDGLNPAPGLGSAPNPAAPGLNISGWRCGSLFSGGGGWEEGAKLVGVRPEWGVELDEDAARRWASNNPGRIHIGDLRTIDPATLPAIEILFTSPPCQGYSKARKQSLAARCDLGVGLDSLRYVRALQPRVVMLEEVPAYVKSPILKKLSSGMAALGYAEHRQIIRAEHHGLPSRRERLYVVWTRGVSFTWAGLAPATTPWNAVLGGLSLPRANPMSPNQLRSLMTRAPRRWPVLLSASWKVGQAGPVGIFHTDAGKVGPPVTKSYEGMAGWRILHADGQLDRFTPRCAARLMGFPDAYGLSGDPETDFGVIGNAVAPPMAAQLLRCLR